MTDQIKVGDDVTYVGTHKNVVAYGKVTVLFTNEVPYVAYINQNGHEIASPLSDMSLTNDLTK